MIATLTGIVRRPYDRADSGQPGPGSKQCIPGQQGNPHPGFKAGVCTNP
ncbi:hypothetical protein [Actinomadura formosensis]